jgi:hypothetical protein
VAPSAADAAGDCRRGSHPVQFGPQPLADDVLSVPAFDGAEGVENVDGVADDGMVTRSPACGGGWRARWM